MTNVTVFSHCFACVVLLSGSIACGESTVNEGSESGSTASSGSANAGTTPPSSTSAAAASGSGQQPAAGSGMSAAGSSARVAAAGSSATGSGTAAAAGGPAAAGGAGAAGGSTAAGTISATPGAAGAATAAGAAGSSGDGGDLTAAAKGFAELFLDVPCDSATMAPLAEGATCDHPPMTQHIEKPVMFAGEAGKKYTLTLHIRGIWEPTNITGGMRPYEKQPFTIGGTVAGGTGSSSDSVNYQQYYIEVAEPKQTYWLNDYQYVAHDIHKQDYEAAITIAGGSAAKVVMNDGNEREIANFPKEMFADVPPYDKMPSLGQSLRLDVVKVEVAP